MSEEHPGLDRRGKALEDAFFAQRDQELLAKFKAQAARDKDGAELARLLGLSDEKVARSLVEAGLRPETVAALNLAPLVAIAWADGRMDKKERDAVLEAAEEQGIAKGSPAHELLGQWLDDPPGAELMECWKAYAAALQQSLDPAEHRRLGEALLGKARAVAKSAGGVLGIGAVSAAEERVLAELKQPFK